MDKEIEEGIEKETLTRDLLSRRISDRYGFSKLESREIVNEFFEQIIETLCQGEHVKISGFGNFILRDKAARPARNLSTGETVPVEARRVVTFKPGFKLKQKLSGL